MKMKATTTTKMSLGLLLLLPGLLNAQQETTSAPIDTPAAENDQTATTLAQDPQILSGKLENGFSYVIRPTKEPAGRGSVRLFVGVGSQNETEINSGISHFLEHMVFNGSRTFKRGELIPTMQKLGLGFGGDANAYTSLLHTVYMLDLPNLDERTVDFALTIVRDFADGATLDDSAIDHERGIVISEMKSRDSENYRAVVALMAQLTEGTRVAKFMPIGTEEVIKNAPYEIVRNYYRDQYVPERMTLVLTGDFDAKTAEEWVKKHFSSMEARRPVPPPALGELKLPILGEKLIHNSEAGNCTVIASVVRPWKEEQDTVAQRIKDLPMMLGLSMINRRFARMAQKSESPFTSAYMNDDEFFHAADYTGLSVTSAPADWKRALEQSILQVRQVLQYGFDAAELQEATTGLLTSLQKSCDTWETIPAARMASYLVNSISEKSVMTTPEENLRVIKLGLERIMANPDICRKALADAFDPARTCLTMTGALPEGVTEADLRAAYEAALKTDVPKPTTQETKPFAYETIGMPGSITAKKEIKELGTTLITLSNGVRVNLKPIDFRKGSISVTAAIDGGSMLLSDKPGLSSMVNAVMSRGGLQEHSMDELERLFAGNNVSLDFSIGQTRFVFHGSTNMKDLELQCKLLAASILHPGFRPEGELQFRRGLDSKYKELTTTPNGAMSMQLRRALFGDDSRFTIPTREEMEAHNAQEVGEVMTPLLKDNALEVSLVGDFNVEEVLPVLERTFGAMPQRQAHFRTISDAERHVDFRPWSQRAYLRYPTELDKTIVAHVRPAGNGRDKRRSRRLAVLQSYVREKLFDGLRAAMGESYTPSVQVVENSEYDNASYIICYSAGVKGNRAKVSAAMETICNGIGQGEISQEDFDCAIRPYITSAEKALITPGFWEDGIRDLQSRPEKIELLKDLLDDVRSITREEIQQLAHDIFGKDNTSFYFVVPEDYDEEATAAPAAQQAQEAAPAPAAAVPAPGEYLVITSQSTAAHQDWRQVADALVQKYPDAHLAILPELTEDALTLALQKHGARYAGVVLRPEEIGREIVNNLHRAARRVDDDPYGDCIWGIVTGYTAADALRIAEAKQPLIIRRLLSTTNVHPVRFEHSYCITDWEGFPVLEQTGYTEPTKTTYTTDTPEGQDIVENGIHGKFAEQLSTQRPQLLVTSSHATPFNLEMPFGKGLIFSANNRFHLINCKQFISFTSALQPAMAGKPEAMQSLEETMHYPTIEPEGTPRVWLAAGNCLLGDARNTNQSMVVTALSAYGCHQFVGYTVPSWYGESGWGTLHLFVGNTDGTTLAEAFFLNNQFLLNKTMNLDPKLMNVHFNEPQIGPILHRDMRSAGLSITQEQLKDAVGLVHDRDTFAFFGDPAWTATVDSSHTPAPLTITWQGDTQCTLTANEDYSGRAAIWFPHAGIGRRSSGCDLEGAIYTNDFILIPQISLKSGEAVIIHLTTEKAQEQPAA